MKLMAFGAFLVKYGTRTKFANPKDDASLLRFKMLCLCSWITLALLLTLNGSLASRTSRIQSLSR